MTEDTEEELLDPSTSEGAETDDSPTSPEDAADTGSSSAEQSQDKASPKATTREALIKSLSQPQKEEDDTEDEEEPESEEAPEAEAAKEGTTEPQSEGSEDPEGSKYDTSDKRSKAKERFEVLTNHNKELKTKLDEATPFAEYGQKLINFCKDSGVTTNEMGIVLAVVATAKKDPAAAATYLEKLGIKPREVVQTVKEIPQELDDKILELVTEGNMTPEGAKALLGITRSARASAPPPAAKKEEAPQKQAPPPAAAPTFADPNRAMYDKAVAKAAVDIDLKASEYATKYPVDWPKLAPKITKAMEEYQGTHPTKWLKFFENEVAKAIATVKKPDQPQQAKTGQPLRPSTSPSGSQKAPATGRKALVAELTGKAGRK